MRVHEAIGKSDGQLLAIDLFDRGLVKYGNFTLKDGSWSPIYVDLRPLASIDHRSEIAPMQQVHLRQRVINTYSTLLEVIGESHHIAGLPEAALSSAGMIGQSEGLSVLQLRVNQKAYGTKAAIEGTFYEGETVRLIDDVVTSGATKLEFAKRITDAGLVLKGIAVLVDREQGGLRQLEEAGLPVVAGIGISALADVLVDRMRITSEQHQVIAGYLNGDITEMPN